MKIKGDFVTNSSSTSFIIGQLNEGALKVSVTIEVDLSRYITEELHTMKDLDTFMEDWGWNNNDERYLKMRQIIHNKGKVFILTVGDEDYDDPIEPMLCRNGLEGINLPDNFVVIQADGGY